MNLWKIFALVMIGLIALAAGLRLAFLEEHSFPLAQEDKTMAINEARNAFWDEIGYNNYSITVQDRGWIISTPFGDKKVVHVVLVRHNITLSALVDLESGKIVEKSKIETGDWMTEYLSSKSNHSNGWGHQRLFRR